VKRWYSHGIGQARDALIFVYGRCKMIRKVKISDDFYIEVKVEPIGDEHIISIDGVEWVRTNNYVHATVLFNMIADHITEYMHYEKK
jgi:hypothetical protein